MDTRTREEVTADYVLHAHKLHETYAIVNSDQEQSALLQTGLEKYQVRKFDILEFETA